MEACFAFVVLFFIAAAVGIVVVGVWGISAMAKAAENQRKRDEQLARDDPAAYAQLMESRRLEQQAQAERRRERQRRQHEEARMQLERDRMDHERTLMAEQQKAAQHATIGKAAGIGIALARVFFGG